MIGCDEDSNTNNTFSLLIKYSAFYIQKRARALDEFDSNNFVSVVAVKS